MKITEITYDKLFPYAPWLNQRIGIKVQVDENDNVDEVFNKAKDQVDKWYEQAGGFQSGEQIIEKNTEPKQNDPVVGIESAINSCTTVKVLESFKLLSSRDESVKKMYDKKMKELTNGA